MAQRRMFSPQIVESEEFLTMPVSSQALYFHLGMNADDDGFIQPKIIMRTTGANDDDLKVLLTKRFLLSFEGGVVVIKHWLIHNLIQKDRYHPTRFLEQKKLLLIKENKAYTEISNPVNKMLTEVRLGKDRLGEVKKGKDTGEQSSQVSPLIDLFKVVNPSYKKFFANKTQRSACQRMLETHGFEKLEKIISFLPKSNTTKYMPVVTTPVQLEDKMGQLASAWQKLKNNEAIIL